MKNIWMVLLLAIALSAAADDAPKQKPAAPPEVPPSIAEKATMCNGPYALCIKAPCNPASKANGYVDCECVMQNGWNMGPNECDERNATKPTSTYSNNFNNNSSTVSCDPPTDWAWCYGAKCEPDPRDPSGKAVICRCPLKTSGTLILVNNDRCDAGGQSRTCRSLWSGALKAESYFANNHYWKFMVDNGYQDQTYPPAPACPAIDYGGRTLKKKE